MMTKKKIILILVSLLLLGGAIAGVLYISEFEVLPEEKTPDTQLTIDYQRETLQIYTCNVYDVDYIHVVNKTGEYKVSRNDDGTVYFHGHEEVPLLPYSSAGLFESVNNIRCEALIETDCTELVNYGLDEPSVIITVKMKNGNESVFHLGDAAPQGGGYYFRDTTNNDVYLSGTYFSERFVKNHTQYYQKAIGKEFEYTGFQTLSIKPNEGEEIYVRTTNEEEAADIRFMGGTIVEKPFFCAGTSTPIQDITEILAVLEAEHVETDVLSSENLTKYGFDTPTSVNLTALVDTSSIVSNVTGLENPYYDPKGNGEKKLITIKYVIGATIDKYTYVIFDDQSVIYAVDKSKLEWVEKNTVDVYCQRMIYLKYLKELARVIVEVDGETHHFDITDPESGDEMIVMYNTYTKMDQAQFRNFYTSIIGVTHDGLAYEPEEGSEPYLKITYIPIEGENIVLEFYQIEPRKYVLKVDGEGRFFTYSSKVEKIVKDMHKLINGEEIMN
ncbi:MAG: DUF4340 domain-containing protein [Clostridia bacterium]|nr:DUF4340 domain-containing protein [Clostridia bacterium]